MKLRSGTRRSGPGGETLREGRVLANFGKQLVVEAGDGSSCRALALRRLGYLACGDRVRWQPRPEGAVVVEKLPAATQLERLDGRGRKRRLAANFDLLVIVAAPLPGFDDRLIDSYLIAAEAIGVPALLLLHKADLLDADGRRQAEALARRYADLDYAVCVGSTRSEGGLDALRTALRGHTAILVGQSGVGKSSIVNQLLPDREVRVGDLTPAGLGSHTTSTTILYPLPGGGELIDSPGVREFAIHHYSETDLARGFREIQPLAGACRFNDCRHRGEPGCAVAAAVHNGAISPRRYENYRWFLDQLQPGRGPASPDGGAQ